jgi:hypothetical protein
MEKNPPRVKEKREKKTSLTETGNVSEKLPRKKPFGKHPPNARSL